MSRMFQLIIDGLLSYKSFEEIKEVIKSKEEFKKIRFEETDLNPQNRKNFTRQVKNAVTIQTYLKKPILCPLCGGHIFSESRNIDHDDDIKNGGKGDVDNGQLTHYYCNSSKDKILKWREQNVLNKISKLL